ncbi:hypothetical protein [Streptomyces rapamycinicus]|uniref:Uncharacterized protein n=1 Tax=Streptomyces rapamycinicus TaxID=1226757 RepID=A0ABR6LPL1_9ACTN|nr:hypothetical protein [Streptomyces rapamycinicus]MBB4784285.1 hypothetical protein [Streptomyces rapamycinicus]UTP32566.1 hypothetical protein LIV37_26395 [Streptomyces rapamycinicus NRRL 5491]
MSERLVAAEPPAGAGTGGRRLAPAFGDVQSMLRHPDTLADPVLLKRAVAANSAGGRDLDGWAGRGGAGRGGADKNGTAP